jgi:hypothetical protein
MQASTHENWYQCAIIDTYSKYDVFEIFLVRNFGETHSKKVIRLCNKYGVVKRATAGYTPLHNAVVERWLQTNGEMSRCQLSQLDVGEESWEDER